MGTRLFLFKFILLGKDSVPRINDFWLIPLSSSVVRKSMVTLPILYSNSLGFTIKLYPFYYV